MTNIKLFLIIFICLSLGMMVASIFHTEPLPDVSQYEVATPIYKH